MPAGRPTVLTPELQQEIVSYLNSGITIETACAACGIAPGTYRHWLRRGRKELDRLASGRASVREAEAPYADFAAEVTRTVARVEMRLAGNISQSANGYDVERITETYERVDGQMILMDRKSTRERERDWKAAAWLLERRHSDRWGARTRLTVTPRDPEAMTDAELDAYIRELEAARDHL